MKQRDSNRMDAFRRAGAFGLERPTVFPAAKLSGQTFAALDAVADKMENDAAAQHAGLEGERGATASGGTLADAVHLDLGAISATAQIVAEDQPGFDKPFLLPDTDGRDALIAAARSVLRALDPAGGDETGQPLDPPPTHEEIAAAAASRQAFLDHEIAPDFLDHLRADLAALVAEGKERSDQGQDHVGATAGIDAAVLQGSKLLRKADRMVKNKLAGNPEELARWATASHVRRVPMAAKQAGQATKGSSSTSAAGSSSGGGPS